MAQLVKPDESPVTSKSLAPQSGSGTTKKRINDYERWPTRREILLFSAICIHKPVGVNRYFQMFCIHDLITSCAENANMTTDDIWRYLDNLYEMSALHEAEISPFSNKEADFFLPEGEYGQLMHAKEEATADQHDVSDTSGVTVAHQVPNLKRKDKAFNSASSVTTDASVKSLSPPLPRVAKLK